MSFTENNHYVPQWYQQRFIPADSRERKYHFLDLQPETAVSNGRSFHRRACWNWGPASCFCEKNLYTLRFGAEVTDELEKRFFGEIDRRGMVAVDFMASYSFRKGANETLHAITAYIDAQKLRTPKGLDWLKRQAGSNSRERILMLMTRLSQMHTTIWMEGVWEVLSCDQSETKFIVSDHPVTTFNRKLFPAARECQYPGDAPIELLGTHTIFPLGLSRCLVITNLGYVRNPAVNPTKVRENPRMYGETVFDLRKIQTGRQIPEEHVRAINFIIKRRAKRYIAAGKEEWLYPEEDMKVHMWDRLGDQLFLMPDPRKVTFTSAIYVSYKDGSSFGQDEYGRRPVETPQVVAQRDAESRSFRKAQADWDSRYGKLPPEYHKNRDFGP
jgi:hypothetical protein